MPKIIGGSLAEHREQVRARVFDALRRQLYERGFDAVTLSGIAAEAQVGRSAMYNHFPDKQHLLVAFVEEEAAHYVSRLRAAVAAETDPVAKLATFVRLQLRVLAEYHLPPGGSLDATLDPAAYRRVAAHADPITEQLREILAECARQARLADEDPEVLLGLITATLGSRQVVDVPAERLGATIETAVRFVLRAIGAIPPSTAKLG